MSWVSYVDESMRQRNDGSGFYVMAAALLDEEDAPEIRQTLQLLAGTHRRFHWRDVSHSERDKAITTVAGLDSLHVVVIGTNLDLRKQERGRRECLRRLLYELHSADVSNIWLETRTQSLNKRDLKAINVFRVQGVIGSTPKVEHGQPIEEPLLWLPDIVAGAINLARGDGDERYLLPLSSLITEHTIQLT